MFSYLEEKNGQATKVSKFWKLLKENAQGGALKTCISHSRNFTASKTQNAGCLTNTNSN